MIYNEFPYEEVLAYLQEKVNNNTLEQLYDQYNVGSDVEDKLSALAEVITDSDMLALGYEFKSKHDGFTDKITSEDESVNDIAAFLAHTVDQDELEHMMDHYKCFSTYDLALALTDDELMRLGYQGLQPIDGSEDPNNPLRMQTEAAKQKARENALKDPYINGEMSPDFRVESDSCPCEGDHDSEMEEDWDSLAYDYEGYDEDLDFLEEAPPTLKIYVIDKGDTNDFGITLACDNEMDFHRLKEALNPQLIDECELDDTETDTGKCIFHIRPHKFVEALSMNGNETAGNCQQVPVPEDVVLNDTLNPVLFDEEHKLLPEVRENILDYVAGFAKAMSDKDIDLDYTDICLVGSNAGFTYQPGSDVDIHLISSRQLDPAEVEKLCEEFDMYEAEHPLNLGTEEAPIPVELGIEDGYDVVVANKNDRRYSVVDEEWVNGSDSFENFKPEDLNKVNGWEQVVQDYTDKINDVVDNDELMNAMILKSEIRRNRSDDLAEQGTLSMGNVVFKELRNNGSYGKLKSYIKSKEEELDEGGNNN